jgi:hypothetical protein
MLAKYARVVAIMRELPDYDQHSWHLSEKKEAEVIASLPRVTAAGIPG